MPTLSIREATQHDLAPLMQLINAAFAIELGDFKDQDRLDPRETLDYFHRGTFLLAETVELPLSAGPGPSAPMACVFVQAQGAEGTEGTGGFLGLLAVHPSRQGLGLGRRMAAEAEAWLTRHGCTFVDLETLDVRPDLPPFYHRLGYQTIRTYPAPCPERFLVPVNFVRMRKLLTQPAPG